jgi:hypothetical protein
VDSNDPSKIIVHPKDPGRKRGKPRVFSGPIGSANNLLKNPIKRDQLRDEFGVKAIEMEGSGIADATWHEAVVYLVVRGICDYCDSKKSDDWQNHAAIVAAAYTRALLEGLSPQSSNAENPPPDVTAKPITMPDDASPERGQSIAESTAFKEGCVDASPRIFLSYARKDLERVLPVFQRLKDEGFAPWMDTLIHGGEKYESAIEIALEEAEFSVLFLSQNYVNRRGLIQLEIGRALDQEKLMLETDITLIPVRLEPVDPPRNLRSFQWIDLFEPDGMEKLIAAIREGIKRRAEGS